MAENLGQVEVVLKSDGTPASPTGGMSGPGGIMGSEHIEVLLENIEDSIEAQTSQLADLLTKIAAGLGVEGFNVETPVDENDQVSRKFSWIAVGKRAMAAFAVAAGIATAGFMLTKKILTKWSDEVERTTARLASLNGQAALAGVITSLGNFRRDLELGRLLGPTLLNIAKLKDAVQDNIAPLKNLFTTLKARTIELLFTALEKLTGNLDQFAEKLNKATDIVLSDRFPNILESIGRASGAISPGPGFLSVLLRLLGESTKQTDAQREANRIAKENADEIAAQNSNQLILANLSTLTGGLWQYQTQTIGAAATGAQINPTGFANSRQSKPSSKTPNQSPEFERNRKRGSGRTRFGS